ncbi:efflux RND transporter periplasmic adaptor subunit [Methylococcus sp. EFPC2]|uniref:efflux RND transporter periplasmic adaptor subunit n=1 Tax=Methylococcus sp. EFPC2 TaxID=2812648 RepID=UPI0019677DD5|nr:efflux RND transporter periplasmic adaptor subunit [Methylococcus sp. EFPC2]QSA97466.1 efflux RND transporter periplasmic adaptor subunit [Methylococcus sp. EFPC2]
MTHGKLILLTRPRALPEGAEGRNATGTTRKGLVKFWAGLVIVAAALIVGLGIKASRSTAAPAAPATTVTGRPALSVTAVQPELLDTPRALSANGSVAAWQEAVIGAEVSGLRLIDIRAQVGDKVKKGQVLAILDETRVSADIAQARAILAETEANLADARANAERAQRVIKSGAMSAQQVGQYLTGEKTAEARVQSAKAQLDLQSLRLRHTRVVATDDGVISARNATLGAVPAEGQELFRLIRQNRLEWRAEVTADELLKIKPGLDVTVAVPGAASVGGKVRAIGPTFDDQNRNALIYVDLPQGEQAGLRPGMFARGEFHLGASPALTVPQDALSLREGFSYVFRLGETRGAVAKVSQIKVQLGRRAGERVEILSGLDPQDRLVASGASFLGDGDSVKVVVK